MQTNEKLPEPPFPVEEIPDKDTLFYRIHKTKIDRDEPHEKRKIMLVAFDPQPKGSRQMSTDWSKYSSAVELQSRARVPSDNGIVSFQAGQVRQPPLALFVQHDPVFNEAMQNRSHAIVFEMPPRKNDIGVRLKLRDICKWEIAV